MYVKQKSVTKEKAKNKNYITSNISKGNINPLYPEVINFDNPEQLRKLTKKYKYPREREIVYGQASNRTRREREAIEYEENANDSDLLVNETE